jgi:hypothetical protein
MTRIKAAFWLGIAIAALGGAVDWFVIGWALDALLPAGWGMTKTLAWAVCNFLAGIVIARVAVRLSRWWYLRGKPCRNSR